METLIPPPPSVGGWRVGYPEAHGGRPGRGRHNRTWVEVPRFSVQARWLPEAHPLSAPPRRHPHVITVSPRKKPAGSASHWRRESGTEVSGRTLIQTNPKRFLGGWLVGTPTPAPPAVPYPSGAHPEEGGVGPDRGDDGKAGGPPRAIPYPSGAHPGEGRDVGADRGDHGGRPTDAALASEEGGETLLLSSETTCTCAHPPVKARRQTGNDPSAGSPTETLLRLLLPLDSQV